MVAMKSGTKTRRASGVALTYDDGPDPRWTPPILDALAAAEAQATFLVDVRRAKRHPELVEAALADGHEVGLHCVDHVRHSERPGEVADEAEAGIRALAELSVAPNVWRTPWGDEVDETHDAADRHGLELWRWSVDTHDWRGDNAEEMLVAVGDEIRDGAVVLMHDALGPGARRDDCAETVAVTERLLELIRDRDLEPATLSDDE
ncbi:chitooligosaccharide deacetylase NodB [soil metagenome]